MSGSEPLWRRVAGLYLSGAPTDAGERMSSATVADADGIAAGDDPTHHILLLGEALDLVTLAQGYQSPVVPVLLRALIRIARQVAAERAATPGGEAPAEEPRAPGTPGAEAPAADEAAAVEPAEAEAPAEESGGETDGGEDRSAELERRLQETDAKLAALTAAVGQLVDVLQRRARNGGTVERRTSLRVPGGSAQIVIHDQPYAVVNWSKGGFLIEIGETDRFSRSGFDFHFVLELPDETVEFQGRARPVRIERDRLAAEFVALDAATQSRIGDIAERLAAGAV